jgi:hypothetical protein
MPDDRSSDAPEIKTDPATVKRVRTQKKFEESMDEKGLLDEDHSLRPRARRYSPRRAARHRAVGRIAQGKLEYQASVLGAASVLLDLFFPFVVGSLVLCRRGC